MCVSIVCRLRVEEASRERARGVLRLVVQRRLQAGGQDAAHPQGVRRRRRGRLERRHVRLPISHREPQPLLYLYVEVELHSASDFLKTPRREGSEVVDPLFGIMSIPHA